MIVLTAEIAVLGDTVNFAARLQVNRRAELGVHERGDAAASCKDW